MEILRRAENDLVVKAIKTASEEMKEKIFSTLSGKAAEWLRRGLEATGAVTLKAVEEAQLSIVEIAEDLNREGIIELPDD